MKIVLLPGLDGTGNLFKPLLDFLPQDSAIVITLPETGEQDYSALATYCKEWLPQEPYMLIAESFSGPIGLLLAATEGVFLKRLVLVATFAQPPRPLLSRLCTFLPLKQMIQLPCSGFASRLLFLSLSAPREVVDNFIGSVKEMPSRVIAKRLRVVSNFELNIECINKPVVYIQPSKDWLVPKKSYLSVADLCSNLTFRSVRGPHFILQVNPRSCAEIIVSVLEDE